MLRLQAGRETAETTQRHFQEVAVRLFLESESGGQPEEVGDVQDARTKGGEEVRRGGRA